MERRKFIKSSCDVCLLAASGFLFTGLSSCNSALHVIQTEVGQGEVKIPLDIFRQSELQFVRLKGWLYDIAVLKKSEYEYEALLLQCTHQRNQLVPTGSGYMCSLHGSHYDRDGKVIKGPAEISLKKYDTVVTDQALIIKV